MRKIIKFFTSTLDGNLAFHVNDNEKTVIKNHKLLAEKLGYNYESLRHMNQVHGNTIEVVSSSSPTLIKSCDAIITQENNIPLMVMVADCIPILMYDEIQGVIAAIHAGRNSTFQNIAQLTALKMINEFGCNTKNINVELGPSIQKCCYEVSPELSNIVSTSFGQKFVNNRLIDLQGINKKQLNDIGIMKIDISTICTKCLNKPYFSYRKDKNTGRFAAVIMLKTK